MVSWGPGASRAPSACLLLAACPQSPHTSCSGIFICSFGRVITISKYGMGKKDLAAASHRGGGEG